MGLRSRLLAAGAALSLAVLGGGGFAGASEDLPAGDYTIEVPGVGTVAFTVDAAGEAMVTALPEGFELAADREVEAEDLSLNVDGTLYEVEFEAENDDDGLTTEIEAEARDDDDEDGTEPDDVEDDGTEPGDDETEADEPDDVETEADGPDDVETEADEPDDDEDGDEDGDDGDDGDEEDGEEGD